MAPGRARRPGVGVPQIEEATPEELDTCPFCEGREDRTPPETLAFPPRQPPDSPGWSVRVVPNLYPAFERQEVVIHSPRHVRSFAELTDDEVLRVTEAWAARRASEPGGYLHALVNEGRAAGASLAHSHSQLVWMRERPPAVAIEPVDGDAAAALQVDAVVEDGDVVLGCPPAGRVPYEMLIAPRGRAAPIWGGGLRTALLLLREGIRRLRALEGPVPWNAWLHAGPRWHVEVVPRLTIFAGIELGAGIYVNTLAPEEAAARLRAAG